MAKHAAASHLWSPRYVLYMPRSYFTSLPRKKKTKKQQNMEGAQLLKLPVLIFHLLPHSPATLLSSQANTRSKNLGLHRDRVKIISYTSVLCHSLKEPWRTVPGFWEGLAGPRALWAAGVATSGALVSSTAVVLCEDDSAGLPWVLHPRAPPHFLAPELSQPCCPTLGCYRHLSPLAFPRNMGISYTIQFL